MSGFREAFGIIFCKRWGRLHFSFYQFVLVPGHPTACPIHHWLGFSKHNHLQNLPKTSKNKRQKCSDDFQFQQLSCPKKQANPRPVRIHSPLPITRLLFQHASLFCLSILLSWIVSTGPTSLDSTGLNHWDPICHDPFLHIHRKIKIVQDAEIKRGIGIFRFLVVSQWDYEKFHQCIT